MKAHSDPKLGRIVATVHREGDKPDTMCSWFATCENDATHLRDAGPLGKVPIYDRCEAQVQAIEQA